MLIGYERVSTEDQSLDPQADRLGPACAFEQEVTVSLESLSMKDFQTPILMRVAFCLSMLGVCILAVKQCLEVTNLAFFVY